MLNDTMLTVTLTDTHPESCGIMGQKMSHHNLLCVSSSAIPPLGHKMWGVCQTAPQDVGGVGHPSAARRYQPPHPLSHPSRKKIPLSQIMPLRVTKRLLPLTAPHRHFMSHTKDTRSPTNKTPPTPLHGSAMMACEYNHPHKT